MSAKKPKPGPKKKVPTKSRSVTLEVELLEAAEAFIHDHPLRPTLPTIINLALRRYLEAENAIPARPTS